MDYYDEGLKKILRDIKFKPKGQLISNWFFGVVDFFQKTKKTSLIVVKLNSFVCFLEEKTISKLSDL